MKVLRGEGDLREVTLAPRPRGLHSALIAEIRSGLPSIVDDDENDALQRRMGARKGERMGVSGGERKRKRRRE